MDPAMRNKPKTLAELMPGLGGIMSNEVRLAMTTIKQPRPDLPATRTAAKIIKPMTIAEMRADIEALKVPTPRVMPQNSTRKNWNSSIKVEKKTISLTANGQMKHNPVRKTLNFQPPKPVPKLKTNHLSTSRVTMLSETPKFVKPDMKAKRLLHHQAHNTVRISGVCNISETPQILNKPNINRLTLANKENISSIKQSTLKKKAPATPKSSLRHRLLASRVPDTPLSNESWKSSCDASFLQNEKDIDYIENKTKALVEEQTLENIEGISPPMSTPFKDYRSVKEFFNNSSNINDCSTELNDDTIMCFDKTSINKENSKREESVIVSLCDMLNKATVSSHTKPYSDFGDITLEIKQTVHNIKMIENGIQTLNNIKDSQLKYLQSLKKLSIEKQEQRISESDKDKTVVEITKDKPEITKELYSESIPVVGKPCSVIKSCLKSPSYKIPRKNTGLRKKVFYKSMPNVSLCVTPPKNLGDKALDMYMKMKEHMNFLSTPLVKKQDVVPVPDTPALTSHNLQKQLDKLYDDN